MTFSESKIFSIRLRKKSKMHLRKFTIHAIAQTYAKWNFINTLNPKAVNFLVMRKFCSKDTIAATHLTAETRKKIYSDNVDDIDTPHVPLLSFPYTIDDELMKRLNESNHQHEIFDAICKCDAPSQLQHLIQSIFLLWDCNNYPEKTLDAVAFKEKLNIILNKLHPHVFSMNGNDLSRVYLYLLKMGVDTSNEVMHSLHSRALQVIEKEETALPTLSRLCVALNFCQDTLSPTVLKSIYSHVHEHLARCASAEDIRLVSICLLNMNHLKTATTCTVYKAKIEELLADGRINAETSKSTLKILLVLSMPMWSMDNIDISRRLMFLLKPSIPSMDEQEILLAFKVVQSEVEPASVIWDLVKRAKHLLDENPTPAILSCCMPYAQPQERDSLTELFKEMIANDSWWRLPNASLYFFSILRSVRTLDVEICESFWRSVATFIDSQYGQCSQQQMLSQCYRYLHFNSNLHGKYRYLPLERQLERMALNAIERETTFRTPAKFANLAAFVIAYGNDYEKLARIPNIIISRLMSLSKQLSIHDCLHISKGLQYALATRFRNNTSSQVASQLIVIENALTDCIQHHLDGDENHNLREINAIICCLNNLQSTKRTLLYSEALSKYKDINYSALSSHTIHDICNNLIYSKHTEANVVAAMFDYIAKNRDHVLGSTVEKVLSCAYCLGYTPETLDAVEAAAHILTRDFNIMNGLSLVRGCLALSFYRSISRELVDKIFSPEFIQRMEGEIQSNPKPLFAERFLNLMMQLNRTICLDFPEMSIPWFQQNYIEAQLSKRPPFKTKFSENVKHFLVNAIKDESCLKSHEITPYGYTIDFMLYLDKNKKPIPNPEESAMSEAITKIAIILLKLDSFCENNLSALRGHEMLRMKHLEMLGFKVIHISLNNWYSKYMKRPQTRINYLKYLLNS